MRGYATNLLPRLLERVTRRTVPGSCHRPREEFLVVLLELAKARRAASLRGSLPEFHGGEDSSELVVGAGRLLDVKEGANESDASVLAVLVELELAKVEQVVLSGKSVGESYSSLKVDEEPPRHARALTSLPQLVAEAGRRDAASANGFRNAVTVRSSSRIRLTVKSRISLFPTWHAIVKTAERSSAERSSGLPRIRSRWLQDVSCRAQTSAGAEAHMKAVKTASRPRESWEGERQS